MLVCNPKRNIGFSSYPTKMHAKREGRTWYHWYAKDDTPTERELIQKLDLLILPYAVTAYWIKYIDQSNISMCFFLRGYVVANTLVQTMPMFLDSRKTSTLLEISSSICNQYTRQALSWARYRSPSSFLCFQ